MSKYEVPKIEIEEVAVEFGFAGTDLGLGGVTGWDGQETDTGELTY